MTSQGEVITTEVMEPVDEVGEEEEAEQQVVEHKEFVVQEPVVEHKEIVVHEAVVDQEAEGEAVGEVAES